MNRNEEYMRLLAELEGTPPALEYTVQRAKARTKKSGRLRRCVAAPLSALFAVFLAFMALVNLSPPFALAVSRIPVLKDLAAAVALSPSLTAAVEHDYVQPIGLEQTDHGVTMRVEYVIVDQKHLNIFYSLRSDVFSHVFYPLEGITLSEADGTPLGIGSYCVTSSGDAYTPDGELQMMSIEFSYVDISGSLRLVCAVAGYSDEENLDPPMVASFEFSLDFDPTYTGQGGVVSLGQSFTVDGQNLTVTTVETYPTYLRLNLDYRANAVWLDQIFLYLENEKGERFESKGIWRENRFETGDVEVQCRLESPFFSESESLTLYVTGVTWLDKKGEPVKIDLSRGTADFLPMGTKLESAIREENGWRLTFSGVKRNATSAYLLFDTAYRDEAGNEYSHGNWQSDDCQDDPERFTVAFSLDNYLEDTVYLLPYTAWRVDLESPVEIKVK